METIVKTRPLFIFVVIASAIVSTIFLHFASHSNSLAHNDLEDIEGSHKTEDIIKSNLHTSDIDRWVSSQSYYEKLCELDRYIFNQKRK